MIHWMMAANVTVDANELRLRLFGGCRCSDDLSFVCEAHDSLKRTHLLRSISHEIDLLGETGASPPADNGSGPGWPT